MLVTGPLSDNFLALMPNIFRSRTSHSSEMVFLISRTISYLYDIKLAGPSLRWVYAGIRFSSHVNIKCFSQELP